MHPVRASSSQLITPDEGYVEMVRLQAAASFAALGNHVSNGATVSAAAVAPYVGMTASITRRASGIFMVISTLTISVNGGTMADADSVTYRLQVVTTGTATLNPIKTTAAVTGATGAAAGYGVVADLNIAGIYAPGMVVGATATFGLLITGVDGLTHTSGVIAVTDGQMSLFEFPN